VRHPTRLEHLINKVVPSSHRTLLGAAIQTWTFDLLGIVTQSRLDNRVLGAGVSFQVTEHRQ
jgi:hypothetical protein